MNRSNNLSRMPTPSGNSRKFSRLKKIDEEKSVSRSPSSIVEVAESARGNRTTSFDRQQNHEKPSNSTPLPQATQMKNMGDIARRNEALRQECQELETSILRLRNQGHIMKMKTSLAMSSLQSTVDSMTREKELLMNHCSELEGKIVDLRDAKSKRAQEIDSLDKVRGIVNGNVGGGGTAPLQNSSA